MGCCKSKPRVDVLTVDIDGPKSNTDKLSSSVFLWKESARNDFDRLKSYCQKHNIHQSDLLVVFKRFLMNDEAYLRNFHIPTLTIKELFLVHSKLTQELADIYIPMLFFKEALKMSPPKDAKEISFARFLVISYSFGNQAMSDLIFEFFCVLRKNFRLKGTEMMYYVNLHQILKLLTEELQKSTALRVIKILMRNDKEDDEISFKNVVRMGMKYPLLFYSLERFRRQYRRIAYGDVFWAKHQHLPPKMSFSDLGLGPNMLRFQNEASAIQQTAMSLISDALFTTSQTIRLSPNFYEIGDKIDDRDYQRLRDCYGYENSNGLIFESGLPVEKIVEPHSNLAFINKKGLDQSYDSLVDDNDELKDNEMDSVKKSQTGSEKSLISSVTGSLSSTFKSLSFKAPAPVVASGEEPTLGLDDTAHSATSSDGHVLPENGDDDPTKGEGSLQDVEEEEEEEFDEEEEDDDEDDYDDYEDMRYKVPEGSETEFIVYDPLVNRSFTYDPATGKNHWINQVISEYGEVVKEFL